MSKRFGACVVCGSPRERGEVICPRCGHVHRRDLWKLAILAVLLLAVALTLGAWLPSSFTWDLVRLSLYLLAGFVWLAFLARLFRVLKARIGCWIYLIILGLLAVGVGTQIGLRFLDDRVTYDDAHARYLKADCAAALPLYEHITESLHFIDAGGYVALSEQETGYCIPFVEAEELQASGDLASALMAFQGLTKTSASPVLADTARQRALALLDESAPADLADAQTCSHLDDFSTDDLLSRPRDQLPALYFACGEFYDRQDQRDESLDMYIRLLEDYPVHALARRGQSALVGNPSACDQMERLESSRIAGRRDLLPALYYHCTQVFEATSRADQAYELYLLLFSLYPEHTLTAQARDALPGNSAACTGYATLPEFLVADKEFLPNFLYQCGQASEGRKDAAAAIGMYQAFLEEYPKHALAADVKSALANLLVQTARESGAGKIAPPQRTGGTGAGATIVVIQNDSPEKIRIVFSGVDPHIEELPACEACQTYSLVGPEFCPEKGPIGRYTLKPGQYDVLVEAVSEAGVMPFTGQWDLKDADRYYSCFVITTTINSGP